VAYADWLVGCGKLEAASYAYTLGNSHTKALSTFKDANKWREALESATRLNMTAEELRGLAFELAESLQTLGQHKDAATLLLQHSNDPEAAIVALVEGGIWDDAIRLCNLHARQDLIETHIRPSILTAAGTYSAEIKENISLWGSNIERLKVVRANKLLLPQYIGSGGKAGADDEASMISGASGWSDRTGHSAASGASFASAASASSVGSQDSVVSWHSLSSKGLIVGGASGKRNGEQRKKKNKHRVTGKVGSLHEEEYIVDLLRGLTPSPSYQHGIGRLIRSMLNFRLIDTAKTLQITFRNYLKVIEANLETVNISVSALAKEKEKEKEKDKDKDKEIKSVAVKLVILEPIAWAVDFWHA